eukprot:TRINITY_DN1249_c3_g1_i1.p1 TRINITY_DN1249_c3_g1~~TRINITY_DN1249_c3_g1_i1.p1  ORF type:complete len:1152 (+),score=460.99 TRINITY_DN1249_c3_g1_i1:85-3456(+)
MTSVLELEKSIRNLRKKISGIEELEKKSKGTKLNDEQKDKIKKKAGLLKDVADMKAKLDALKAGGEHVEEEAANGNGHTPEPTPEPVADTKKEEEEAANEAAAGIDKEVKKLEKKLRGVKELKDKKEAGEELNAEQLKKLKTLQKLQQELHALKMEKEKVLKEAKSTPKMKAADPVEKVEKQEEEIEEEDPLKVDKSRLMLMYKEFDQVNDLARRIAMGKLKNPTQIQKNRAAQVSVLQAAITKEEERIVAEEKRLRKEAGLPEEEPEPEPELSEKEKKLQELNKQKAAAVEAEDFEEAGRLKKLIAKVEAGEEEEEPAKEEAPKEEDKEEEEWKEFEEKAKEHEEAAAPEPEEPEPEEPEPEAEPEPEPVREPTPEPEPVQEPEPEPEPEPTPKPPPKTAEELGISFVSNKRKKQEAAAVEEEEEDEDDDSPRVSFDEMMREAQAKRAATAPYTETFGPTPAPKKSEAVKSKKEGILAQQAAKRLLKDLRDIAECPLYTVKAEPANDDLFTWHANVAPMEGPYAGSVIHFVIYFPNTYPVEAPVVRCCSSISHESIHDTPRHTSEVCLQVNDRGEPKKSNDYKGWCPAYTARTILSHLASMFDSIYVTKQKGKKLDQDKLKLQQFVCKETGHCLESPYPPVPCFNGPFDKTIPEALKLDCGAVWTTSGEVAGHYWLHNYSGEGRHYFRSVLRVREEATGNWRLGYSTPMGNALELGSDDQGWAYEPATGLLHHNGETIDTGVKAAAGDAVDCVLDLNNKKVSFSVNGTDIEQTLDLSDVSLAYHPTFSFGVNSGAEMIFVPNSATLPSSSLPIASVSSVVDNTPRCCVTKDDSDECILGYGLKVDRSAAGIVEAITPEPDLISQDAFVKSNVRRSIAESKPLTSFFPLLLNAHHGAKVRPLLENAIAEVLRNPKAVLPSRYSPPFKAASVVTVISLALEGVCETLVGYFKGGQPPKEYFITQAVLMWANVIHVFRSLCSSRPVVVEHGQKLVAAMLEDSSKLSTAGLLFASKEDALVILKGLLRQQVSDSQSLDIAYKGKARSRVQFLLLLHVLYEAFRASGLEDLTSSSGKPASEQVEDFKKACQTLAAAKSIGEAIAATGVSVPDDELEAMLTPAENTES